MMKQYAKVCTISERSFSDIGKSSIMKDFINNVRWAFSDKVIDVLLWNCGIISQIEISYKR